jgi:hypothetical protein
MTSVRIEALCTGYAWIGIVSYIFDVSAVGIIAAALWLTAGVFGVLRVGGYAAVAAWYFLDVSVASLLFAFLAGVVGLAAISDAAIDEKVAG